MHTSASRGLFLHFEWSGRGLFTSWLIVPARRGGGGGGAYVRPRTRGSSGRYAVCRWVSPGAPPDRGLLKGCRTAPPPSLASQGRWSLCRRAPCTHVRARLYAARDRVRCFVQRCGAVLPCKWPMCYRTRPTGSANCPNLHTTCSKTGVRCSPPFPPPRAAAAIFGQGPWRLAGQPDCLPARPSRSRVTLARTAADGGTPKLPPGR